MWALPSTSTSGLEEVHTRASLLLISQVLGCKPQPPIENAHFVAPKYTGAPIGYAGRGIFGKGKRAHAPSHKKPKGQYDMVSTNRKSPRGRRWETQYINGHFILKQGIILHLRNMISRRRSAIHYFHDDDAIVRTQHMRCDQMTPRVVFWYNPPNWRMHQTHCPFVKTPNRSSHIWDDKGLNLHLHPLGKKPFNYGICQPKHDAKDLNLNGAYLHAQIWFRWNDFGTNEHMRSSKHVPQIKYDFDIVQSLNPPEKKATDRSGMNAAERSPDQLRSAQEATKGSWKRRRRNQTKNIDFSNPKGFTKVELENQCKHNQTSLQRNRP